MNTSCISLACVLGLASVFPVAGKAISSLPVPAGQYRDWKGAIDTVEVIQPFQVDAYRDIYVEPFATSDVRLPKPTDGTYEAVKTALGSAKTAFIEGLQENLRGRVIDAKKAGQEKARALIIRVRVRKFDVGAADVSYFNQFGRGAVRIAVSGEIIDGDSLKTLVRFTQERRSGYTANGAGYSGHFFDRTTRQIGGDVATLLSAF